MLIDPDQAHIEERSDDATASDAKLSIPNFANTNYEYRITALKFSKTKIKFYLIVAVYLHCLKKIGYFSKDFFHFLKYIKL